MLRRFLSCLGALFAACWLAPEPGLAAERAAVAQPSGHEDLGLRDALKRAIDGNRDLQQDRVSLEIQDANLMVAQGRFDFLLTSNLRFSRSTTPPLSTDDVGGGFTNFGSLNLALVKPLETGGSVQLSATQRASTSNSRFSCGTVFGMPQTCTFYGNDLALTFSHPLLQGFGTEVAQANIRRLRVQKDQALLQRQMRASNIVRDVVIAYWELAYATRDLAIRTSAVDLAREQLRITEAQIEVGRLAPVDSAAVERAIGERMQEIAVSEQSLLFRTLDLRRLFGLTSQSGLVPFAASNAPEASPIDLDLELELARALESNPQLRSVKMGLQLSEIDLQTAMSTLRPRLDFVGAVGSTGRKRSLSDSLAQTVGLDEITMSAGLDFSMPVQNRVGRGMTRAAELSADNTRLLAGTFELDLRDQVVRLVTIIGTAGKRVTLAHATVGYAEKNLEAEKTRFSVGRTTNDQVLLRQQELKTAQIAVVRATVDLLNGEAALGALSGQLLERHGIILRGI